MCGGKGKLPLGKGDDLECPDCAGDGLLVMNEYRYDPLVRTVYIPGVVPHEERKLFVPRIKGVVSGFGRD
jgi:hypothetical protein